MNTVTPTSTIADILHLDELPVDEQALVLDQIGTLIMESATLRFLTDASPSTQDEFMAYLEANSQHEDFLLKLLELFPDFATIMMEEIKNLEVDLRRVLGE